MSDDELYDEDGLLREEVDVRHGDKSNLISSMQKILQIKKKGPGSKRREALSLAGDNVEEFTAIKRRSGGGGSSSLSKLLDSVASEGEASTLKKVSQLVKAPSLKPVKTLDAPLHKIHANKAKRSVLYDNAKKDVSRFNAIVYHNRAAPQMTYPLEAGNKVAKLSQRQRLKTDFVPMTPLEEEMARVLYGEEYVAEKKAALLNKNSGPSEQDEYALSVEEALSLHHEMARLRAQTSYQMVKAKRQSKIKSKKYHRLLRKEKIRKQLKDFETLQKTDPDLALEKLEELNKSRVEERMNLKHRNTSKWSKMQAARAKYNKDSRVALSEQLQISRSLTQKIKESSDEDEDEDDVDLELPNLVKSSLDNPWMLDPSVKDNDKLQLYYSGYKKLWETINAKKEKERKSQQEVEQGGEDGSKEGAEEEKVVERLEESVENGEKQEAFEGIKDDIINVKTMANNKRKNRKKRQKAKHLEEENEAAPTAPKKLKILDSIDETDFSQLDVDMMIEAAEDKIAEEASLTLKKLTKEQLRKKRSLERKTLKQKQAKIKKTKSKKAKEGDADEIRDLDINPEPQLLENGKESLKTSSGPAHRKEISLDPENFLKIPENSKTPGKKNKLGFKSPAEFSLAQDSSSEGEEEEEEAGEGYQDQKSLIALAFEDDDVVSSFKARKEGEIASSTPQDIDLSLPGWGEWGGSGILPNEKKKKRFTIKAKPAPPRRDAALSHVILNQEAGEGMKQHLVKELPFPFTRVKDFEKTIRAPVGRTWLPEQAVRDNTKPKVITRLGSIIQPLDEDVLAKTKSDTSDQDKGSSSSKSRNKGKGLKVPLSIKRLAKVKK